MGDRPESNSSFRQSDSAVLGFAEEMDCREILELLRLSAEIRLCGVVLVAQKNEESDRRVIARAKSNTSVDTGGFAYTIEQVALHRGITTVRVVWREVLHGSARDILASVENDGSSDDGSKFGVAKAFLISALANGPVESKHLVENAREMHEISKDTLKRAKTELCIVARKSGIDGPWLWEFPFNPSALTVTQAR